MNQSTESTLSDVQQNEPYENYYQLVWKRFRKSKIAIIGGLMTLILVILAIFSDFFSPSDPMKLHMRKAFQPPQRIHLVDAEGSFHFRPFVYNLVFEYHPTTFERLWREDTSQRYPVTFFARSWRYKFLGIPMRWHFFGVKEGGTINLIGTDKFGRDLWGRACQAGRISLAMALFATIISVAVGSVLGIVSGYYGGWVDGLLQRFLELLRSLPVLPLWMALAAVIPSTWDAMAIFVVMSIIFALLGWTTLAREVRGKVMALRETDFILAAKEMGASDARIIFRHLYPNSLSHIIVILTLTIPEIILAESFLSFLGIGIQPPLISWGVLMRNAYNIQTLGSHPWITIPVAFILVAVLGFNFLGDGLRDAADPYSIV